MREEDVGGEDWGLVGNGPARPSAEPAGLRLLADPYRVMVEEAAVPLAEHKLCSDVHFGVNGLSGLNTVREPGHRQEGGDDEDAEPHERMSARPMPMFSRPMTQQVSASGLRTTAATAGPRPAREQARP